MIILFQGDSITASGRNPKKKQSLGTGYVMMASAWLSALHPELDLQFFNRGVSGDKVRDLSDRWERDVIDLKPDVVSILVGINDVLGKYLWKSSTSLSDFENSYRFILNQSKDKLDAKIILMEPFIVPVAKEVLRLRADLDQRINVVRKLSEEYGTLLVPLSEVFEEVSRKKNPAFWSEDGIHTTLVGHALIAQSWLNVFQAHFLQSI